MSAHIVSKAHIDALVLIAAEGPQDRAAQYAGDGWSTPHYRMDDGSTLDARHNPELIGSLLWQENILSVSARYPTDSFDTLPGPCELSMTDVLAFDYQRAEARRLTTVEALKAIDGYCYQSCEHPGWKASAVYGFVQQLRGSLIGCLPGYDTADSWSIA